MFLIVGLGNPTKEYDNTYHNIGFMVLDSFAKSYNVAFSKKKCDGLFAEAKIADKKVLLLKPQTYMNNSGTSVWQMVKKYKIALNKILVVYDDIDIPVGQYRLRKSGSAGSHNGMKSIIGHLGQEEFARLRVGIGAKYFDLADYVLSKISAEHKPLLDQSITTACGIITEFVVQNGDIDKVK